MHSFPILLSTAQHVAVPAAATTTASSLLIASRNSGSNSWYRDFGHDALIRGVAVATTAWTRWHARHSSVRAGSVACTWCDVTNYN
eukprot:COSAG05_NODE_2359_length_3183_cov_15.437743_1_plen_85_part_10